MSRYDDMMARMGAGECVLIDGATGTEAERRGVPQLDNAWNGGGALSHPDIVRQVHLDYLEAGAEVIISNSFATHLHALEAAGEGARFEDYNRRAVELAVEARAAAGNNAALVAGGMSYWSWRGDMPPAREMRAAATRQASVMKAAGADLIMLEMMVDQANLDTMLEAVRDIGLPVWAGITTGRAPDGHIRLREGDPLAPAVRAIAAGGVELINIMHTEVEFVSASIDDVRRDWGGPIGVYAHSSTEIDKRWVFEDVITPHDYADLADGWRAQGVSLIGGCCGIGEAHIDELCRRMTE
ncbi:MAG: homocysteine S-methyltransferase family protein [Candidatus Puniceispirillaceae bacterium]